MVGLPASAGRFGSRQSSPKIRRSTRISKVARPESVRTARATLSWMGTVCGSGVDFVWWTAVRRLSGCVGEPGLEGYRVITPSLEWRRRSL